MRLVGPKSPNKSMWVDVGTLDASPASMRWSHALALTALLAAGCSGETGSDEANVTSNLAPLFADESTLHLELRAPFKKINDGLTLEGDLQPGEIVVGGKRIPIQIGPRGRTSMQECTFRKLEVEISDVTRAAGTPFAGLESFKIGTHCDLRDGISLFGRLGNEEAVFRERLAYRWYQEMTPFSLGTRRAVISYVSTDGGPAPGTKHAFFLEDFKTFRKRIHAEKVEARDVVRAKLDQSVLATSYVLELLVANSDWQIGDLVRGAIRPPQTDVAVDGEEGSFNFKVFRPSEGGDIPLPYDFDIAGVVVGEDSESFIQNAAFVPDESAEVHEQIFHIVGYWRMFPDDAVRTAAIASLLEARPAIEQATDDAELDPAGKKLALARQKTFFDALKLASTTVKALDRGPLTLFESKSSQVEFCTQVNGAEPIVVVEQTSNRIGFQFVVETIDDTQCEGLPHLEFAPVDKTFYIDKARVVVPDL